MSPAPTTVANPVTAPDRTGIGFWTTGDGPQSSWCTCHRQPHDPRPGRAAFGTQRRLAELRTALR